MALSGQTNVPKSSLPYGGRWSRGKRWWNSNKHLFYICLILLTVIIGAGGGAWWMSLPSLQRVASAPLEKRAQIAAPKALAPPQAAPEKAEKPASQALQLEAQSGNVTVTGPVGQGDAATEEDRVGLPAKKALSPVDRSPIEASLASRRNPQYATVTIWGPDLFPVVGRLFPSKLLSLSIATPEVPVVVQSDPPVVRQNVASAPVVKPAPTNLPVVEVVVTPKVQARKVAAVPRPRLPPAPTTVEGLPDIPAILRMPKTYWDVVGNDPFERDPKVAKSRPIRERAFKELGLSGACLERALDITNRAGVRGTIRNGDEFIDSESGSGPHMNQEATFAQDGSEDWTLTCSTTTLLVRLADGCNNWGLALPPPTLALVPPVVSRPVPELPRIVTPPVQEACVEIDFDDGQRRDVVWVGGFTNRAMSHPECWKRQKNGVWVDMEPVNVCGYGCPIGEVLQRLPRGGAGFALNYLFWYEIEPEAEGRQRILVPAEMKEQFPGLCIARPNVGPSFAWIVGTSLWRGSVYHIPDNVPDARWPIWLIANPAALLNQDHRGVAIQ